MDDVPAKVKCNTCEGEHKYHRPAAAKKSTTKKVVAPRATGQKDWQELRTKIEEVKAVDYSMDSSFKVNTVIKHPIFGLGLFEKIIGDQKMEVIFEDGRKKLRCL